MIQAIVNETFPKMDTSSAVYPTVRVIGDALIVAYHLPGCNTSAVIRFDCVKDWAYGSPNDEELQEHPLWGKGLTFYEFHEVQPSEGDVTQWIGTFHDGTLTVRAKSVEVIEEQARSEPWDAIDAQFGKDENMVLDEQRWAPLKISKHVWTSVETRPCKFSLCLEEGGVFADFDIDSDGRAYLVRISFDGYGCCRTNGTVTRFSLEESRTLTNLVDADDVNRDDVREMLHRYFDENKNVIWQDALEYHKLLKE